MNEGTERFSAERKVAGWATAVSPIENDKNHGGNDPDMKSRFNHEVRDAAMRPP